MHRSIRSILSAIILLVTLLLAACAQMAAPGLTPTILPTFTLTIQPSPSPTDSPTQTLTASPTHTPSRTPAPSTTLPATRTATPFLTPTLIAGHAPTLSPMKVTLIRSGSRDLPYVALTFDLCQKPEIPARFDRGIYDVLVGTNTRATFFMGGDWMRTHPAETRLLAGSPLFELGNHSWSHPDLPDLDQSGMSKEILRAQDMLYQLTGRQPRLFRLPAGKYNDLALGVVAMHGLYTIQWDADTADPVPDNSAENILRLVKERTKNGSIILMHANGRGWHTAEALPGIIDYLRGEGFCLVTVAQLIGLDPIPAECSAK